MATDEQAKDGAPAVDLMEYIMDMCSALRDRAVQPRLRLDVPEEERPAASPAASAWIQDGAGRIPARPSDVPVRGLRDV